MIKFFLFLFSIFYLTKVWGQENIKFIHEGEEKKPFTTLIVSYVDIDVNILNFESNEVLPKKIFNRFKKLIFENVPKSDKRALEVGSFKIEFTTDRSIKTYHIETRKESIAFFTKILSVIENWRLSERLYDVFKVYLSRMDLSTYKPIN